MSGGANRSTTTSVCGAELPGALATHPATEMSGPKIPSPGQCGFPWQLMVIDLTGEVLPCPYFHFADTGRTLGNTNTSSIAEIWNGPAYRELRERHLSGDLSGYPCGDCLAYRTMGGLFPRFEWGDGFREEQGRCYIAQIPEGFWERNRGRPEQITLFEDGLALSHAESPHDEIRQHGRGRYSAWRGFLYMAASDDSNPARNGHRYELRCGEDSASMANVDKNSDSARNIEIAYEEFCAGATTLAAQPSKITFIETSDCNIDCPACSQNEVRLNHIRHRPQTNPDVLARVPLLQELIWHGGEPYMMPRFRRFIDEFSRDMNPNFSFGFMSNGTMITAAEAKKLEKFDRFNVTISIDSFVKQSYERMRVGARYDHVMPNLFRVLAMQDWPKRKVVVAMIIGKSNFRDLTHNIRFGLDHDIRLMINPITQYPPTEKLTLYADFSGQTEGWEAVLLEAEGLLEEAHKADRRSLRNLDPTGALRELRAIYEQQKRDHAELVELIVDVEDPQGSLSQMRRPGLLVYGRSGPYSAVAYAELSGPGAHRLLIPKSRFSDRLFYGLWADLFETGSEYEPEHRQIDSHEGDRIFRKLQIPPYVAPPRPKNVHYVKSAIGDGLALEERDAMLGAYAAIIERERQGGYGFLASLSGPKTPTLSGSDADPVTPRSDTQAARTAWLRFLPNYFRPFVNNNVLPQSAGCGSPGVFGQASKLLKSGRRSLDGRS
jgi:radical SAM protein with 4Fe4S-binding SPASM domain